MAIQDLKEWINDLAQIPCANDQCLRRSLLTVDGRGIKLKEAVLEELLKRARNQKGHQ